MLEAYSLIFSLYLWRRSSRWGCVGDWSIEWNWSTCGIWTRSNWMQACAVCSQHCRTGESPTRVSQLVPSSSSSRACPSLERSRFHCPLPPFTILSPLPSWYQVDVERPQVLFSRTKPSSSRLTGRLFPVMWQSRNNWSKSMCMIHSDVNPCDMTKKT